MKKIFFITVFALVLSVSLSLCAFAVIQSPPKDEHITAEVYKTDKSPLIDGEIKSGEYKKLDIPKSSLSYVVGSEADWIRAKNTEFTAYGAVYGKTFYFALSVPVDPEYYITECEPKYLWAQTSLLMSFAKTGTEGRSALEIGIRPGGDHYIWKFYNDTEFLFENNFAAVYKNGVATYEIAVPVSAFGAENDFDFLFCFSVSAGDYFNGGRQVYVQFGRGISGFSDPSDADAGKNTALFPKINITDVKEPDVKPGDGDEDMPDTGLDLKTCFALSAAVMIAAVSAIHTVKRKANRDGE